MPFCHQPHNRNKLKENAIVSTFCKISSCSFQFDGACVCFCVARVGARVPDVAEIGDRFGLRQVGVGDGPYADAL